MKNVIEKFKKKDEVIAPVEVFEVLLVNQTTLVATEKGVACDVFFQLAKSMSGRDWEQLANLALEGYTFELRVVAPKEDKK